jgi:hypothetical protein
MAQNVNKVVFPSHDRIAPGSGYIVVQKGSEFIQRGKAEVCAFSYHGKAIEGEVIREIP